MTSYVKNKTWYEKENLFKMFLWSRWTTFYHNKYCLKIKLRWRNRRPSQNITEKRQMSKTGHYIKKMIFLKCFSDHADQLLPRSKLLKSQFKMTKQEVRSKNYWETAKWRLYDVIRQNQNMIWKRKFFQNVSLIILNNFYHI